jgi:multidrug efflux pump subunit AcrA (membrane-fusion protein)
MKPLSLVVLFASLAVIGCQPGLSEKDVVGTWSGSLSAADLAPAEVPAQVKQMLSGQTIAYNVTFKEDKTWSVPISLGQFINTTISGTWSLEDGKVKTVTTEGGGETTLWTVSDDKKSLQGTIRNAQVTLTKGG